jgi:hypothetical protein
VNTWILLQIAFNILFALAFFVFWSRLKRPPQDDPRLSRGLQLLQTKISVLEDLSERTEVQVKQLTTLLEHKGRELQQKIQESAVQIHRIDQSMQKSLEVAEIFQDKIPHEEIIERQNSVKYLRAARLAHQGLSVDDIVNEVGLPKSEVEFITKVNRDQLMFDSDQLPEWAKEKELQMALEGNVQGGEGPLIEMNDGGSPHQTEIELGKVFEASNTEFASLKEVDKEFKQACRDFEHQQEKLNRVEERPKKIVQAAESLTASLVDRASDSIHKATEALHKTSGTLKDQLRDHIVEKAERALGEGKVSSDQSLEESQPFLAPSPQEASQSEGQKESQFYADQGGEMVEARDTDGVDLVNQELGEMSFLKEALEASREDKPSLEGGGGKGDRGSDGRPHFVLSKSIAESEDSSALTARPGSESHLVPHSYLKETLNHNRAEDKKVEETQVKKVIFPRVDQDTV